MDSVRTAFKRVMSVEAGEHAALGWSFAMFFGVLASYFTIRPLRETMGASLTDGPAALFSIVFIVMLVLVPVFGFIATSLPRRHVVPVIYGFFIANLIAFSFAIRTDVTPLIAACFFVWVSVYNLFVVSLFWSLMSESWSAAQGTRLFGVIAAGGTVGSNVAPFLVERLVPIIGTAGLPLLSASFLVLGLVANDRLRTLQSDVAADGAADGAAPQPVTLAAVVDGATQVLRSPYLARIAVVILLANLVSTYFYLEQTRLVKGAFLMPDGRPDAVARVAFFASRDQLVAIATAAIQLFGTAHILGRFGVTAALAALPVVCIIGLLAISAAPVLSTVADVMVIERITAFALAGPAMRVLYTVVEPDEKYKAQNFIDTVVYRGGDALSGWMFGLLGKTLALSAVATIAATLPFAALWLVATLSVGRMQKDKAHTR